MANQTAKPRYCAPGKKKKRVNKPKYFQISNTANETVDLKSLFDSNPADNEPCRAKLRTVTKERARSRKPEAKAMINGNIGSILLDSGAVDRSFITYAFVSKYNLLKHKLAYKINVKSTEMR